MVDIIIIVAFIFIALFIVSKIIYYKEGHHLVIKDNFEISISAMRAEELVFFIIKNEGTDYEIQNALDRLSIVDKKTYDKLQDKLNPKNNEQE